MRVKICVVVAAAACAACGAEASGREERLSAADAAKLPTEGQLGELCPVPDVPQDFREEVSRTARKRARAMIREVRRRPDALVTLGYEDAHSGEPFEETLTVRELGLHHLEHPGIEGASCERKLMAELEGSVHGRATRKVANERVVTLQEIVKGLRLDKDGAVYFSPDGCQVQSIYFNQGEVAQAEPGRNEALVASPQRRVGVAVYKPDRRCRDGIARDLARLDR